MEILDQVTRKFLLLSLLNISWSASLVARFEWAHLIYTQMYV
jgi:hypothetical protein